MPTGSEHVQATIELCQRLAATLAALQSIDKPAIDDVAARLAQMQSSLVGMQDRFFLRSKLCLPFAARCEQEAHKLEQAVAGWTADPSSHRAVQEALKSAEQAVKLLDDRSGAQGMVIT